MARYRVIYRSNVGGKHDAAFDHKQALVSATGGSDGYPIPANIITALTNNNLHNTKAGAVIVLESIANLDERAVAVFS